MQPPGDSSSPVYDEAVELHKQQQFEKAVERYRDHLKASPEDARALAQLAAAIMCSSKGTKKVRRRQRTNQYTPISVLDVYFSLLVCLHGPDEWVRSTPAVWSAHTLQLLILPLH